MVLVLSMNLRSRFAEQFSSLPGHLLKAAFPYLSYGRDGSKRIGSHLSPVKEQVCVTAPAWVLVRGSAWIGCTVHIINMCINIYIYPHIPTSMFTIVFHHNTYVNMPFVERRCLPLYTPSKVCNGIRSFFIQMRQTLGEPSKGQV